MINNYNPALLTVDPNNGAVSVSFTYSEVDAAGQISAAATVTMPFTTLSVSGNVFDDANGLNPTPNNTVDGIGTNAGGLTAILINGSGNVVSNATVNADGTYIFPIVDPGTYTVLISTTAGTVGNPAPTPSLQPDG